MTAPTYARPVAATTSCAAGRCKPPAGHGGGGGSVPPQVTRPRRQPVKTKRPDHARPDRPTGEEPSDMSNKVPDETFDLRALVRQVITGSSLRGPREISAKVLEMIPPDKLRAALAIVLPEYVRIMLHDSPGTPSRTGAGNLNSARSPKVRAQREYWREMLTKQRHVGHGKWKQLAECSYDEVMFLASERADIARRTAAAGEMYEAVAAEMKKRKVAVVADLPEATLARLLAVEDVAA